MPSQGSLGSLTRTKKGLAFFWSALFILSLAFQYAAAASPRSALAASANFCDSFSIQTSDANGGPVNQNHYGSKPEVYLQGGPDSGADTLPAGTLVYYQVQAPNGDPLMSIRSIAIGGDGTFRVQLAPFATTPNPGGEYKVVASTDSQLNDPGCTKSDNFKVDGPGTLKVTKTVNGGPNDFSGSFPIAVDCGIAGDFEGVIVVPEPGFVTFLVDALAECTVTEGERPDAPAGYSWGDISYTDNPATVASGGTVTVGVVNPLNLIPVPELTIVKSVSATGLDGSWVDQLATTTGATVHYKITITNTGDVPLTDVSVSDDLFNLEECDFPSTLAVDADADCHYTDIATTGETVNTATADSEETGKVSDTATVVATVTPPPPTLVIEKTNNAPLKVLPGTDVAVQTANEGETVTFTLTFTFTGDAASDGEIVDYLPKGLTYVEGSATANNGEFYFDGYDAATHSLAWFTDGDVTKSGVFTYQATVDEDAAELEQPLENVVSIVSDDTKEDTAFSTVFVPAVPLAETSAPTAPPTDLLASSGTSAPGGSLMLLLLALAGLGLAIVVVTPVPTSIKNRIGRR